MRQARIRMYRQGLGDCFLLTLPRAGARSWHMLIDCGALKGTPRVAQAMQAVAEDIIQTTGGHLDVLVATHEHWDHLSGFLQAQDRFDTLSVGEVWLAWTEDPSDELANELRVRRRKAQRAIQFALQALAAAGGDDEATSLQLGALLGFEGDLAADGRPTTSAALDWVKARPNAEMRLLRPGDRAPVGGAVDGLTVFVLGPPHDRTQIKRSDPSKRHSQVYELGGGAGADSGFYAAAEALDDGGEPGEQPFERFFALPPKEAEKVPLLGVEYLAKDGDWRRVDRDWLGVAGQLALKLNSDTNNTSLVLAFELGAGGPVLLFPGDAQVGNWESWETVTLTREDATEVTSTDLLARTVLYKVGHHGSHNATLRQKGLELMTSPDLVAMIPVNRATAEKQKWLMPFPPLYDRLMEKAGGRVLEADKGLLGTGSGPQWDAFKARTRVSRWFVDYTLEW